MSSVFSLLSSWSTNLNPAHIQIKLQSSPFSKDRLKNLHISRRRALRRIHIRKPPLQSPTTRLRLSGKTHNWSTSLDLDRHRHRRLSFARHLNLLALSLVYRPPSCDCKPSERVINLPSSFLPRSPSSPERQTPLPQSSGWRRRIPLSSSSSGSGLRYPLEDSVAG